MRNDFYVGCYDDPSALAHHGVKGMKWGIRRYQNPDGSYTAAGRRRYGMNLDINDTSRVNVAKIRRGEVRRQLDVAKANKKKGEGSNYRIAELKAKQRTAKQMVKYAKRLDRGAKKAAKGQTITGNTMKAYLATGAAVAASEVGAQFLKSRLGVLGSQGRLRAGHLAAAKAMNMVANATLTGAAFGYSIKKARDNRDLRTYNASRYSNRSTIKYIGGTEYKDVVERRKKKG